MTTDDKTRARFQGVRQIFAYNRPFYLCTVAGVFAVGIASIWLAPKWRFLSLLGAGAAAIWIGMSLVVSHWVYDLSPLYSFDWLPNQSKRWANIHAGLDEVTPLLRRCLPTSTGVTFDVFDKAEMPEPSIAKARVLSLDRASIPASWKHLPLPDQCLDGVFLIFAAHEFRAEHTRIAFLREAGRILAREGSIVMVEHLRDLPNFLAFGPGFFHFFSYRTWKKDVAAASLKIKCERRITPFVRMFQLTHPTAG